MTAPTKTTSPSTSKPSDQTAQPEQAGPARTTAENGTSGGSATLAELARAQEDLTHEIRQLVARQVLEDAGADDRERAGRIVTVARAELLTQLREQEQEQARRQLMQAARSSEEAVDGVVRSMTTVVRTLVPVAFVRPEDLIEAAYTVADQGLRVVRRFALSVSSGMRSLTDVR